jgi:hypothetical protein
MGKGLWDNRLHWSPGVFRPAAGKMADSDRFQSANIFLPVSV